MNMLCSDKTGTLTLNKMTLQEHTPVFVEGADQARTPLPHPTAQQAQRHNSTTAQQHNSAAAQQRTGHGPPPAPDSATGATAQQHNSTTGTTGTTARRMRLRPGGRVARRAHA